MSNHSISAKTFFDVIIVGAGIPGLYAARELNRSGRKILLLESSLNPELPNYSTAGIPIETMQEFELPKNAINAYIQHQIIGSGGIETKKSSIGQNPFAVVLDFGKCKRILGEQCLSEGVHVSYGERFVRYESSQSQALPHRVITERATYSAMNIIDASGSSGVVLTQAGLRAAQPDKASIGMEYQIRTKRPELLRFQNTIAIYFSREILPNGYGWVFADGDDVFKVGLIEYWTDSKRGLPPLEQRLKKFVEFLGVDITDSEYEIIGKHGGRKIISKNFDRVRQGRIYGIGDSIGAINPFLAEGIRQGLVSAKLAVDAIQNDTPETYEKQWLKFKGLRWKLSELFAHLCYESAPEGLIQSIASIAEKMTSEELRRLVFQYEFEHLFKRAPLQTLRAITPHWKEIASYVEIID